MKTTFTLLLLLCIGYQAHSQYYNQYFDGADTSASNSLIIQFDTTDTHNIWQIGPPQKTLFTAANSAPNVLVTDTIDSLPANDTSRVSFRVPVNYWWGGTIAVQWLQKLDFRKGIDGGYVEFRTDADPTWYNAADHPQVYNYYGFDTNTVDTLPNGEYGFTGTDTTWRDIWLCFDGWFFSQSSYIEVRFTSMTGPEVPHKDGWMIDNLLSHITLIHTIPEVEQAEYIRAYPTPTTGRVHLETKKLDEFHIIKKMELMDQHGRIVERFGAMPTKTYIDIAGHAPGNYFLNVTTNLKEVTVPIVLQN